MRATGDLWENIALAHLQQARLQLLTRNYSNRYGEIDLIMREENCVVFVEVRFRNLSALGDGAASVGASKRAKLIRAAAMYLQAHPAVADLVCRFDVLSCSGTSKQPHIDWQKHAFEAYF